jgi:amino acid adenylation domain-containing protein/non-ribosomal peptide synthase protein (TIGR01720 family)
MNMTVFLTELFQQGIRVRLEDDKLKVDAPKGALTQDIKATLSANKSALIDYLRYQNRQTSLPVLARVDRAQAHFSLSSAQDRMWFLQRFEQDSGEYNVNALLALTPLTESNNCNHTVLFKRVFTALIAKQEVFRTAFVVGGDGRPQANLLPSELLLSHWDIAVEDFRADPNGQRHYEQALKRVMQTPFNLAEPPLFRLTHFLLPTGESHLLLTFHHIIVDHWSLQNLTRLMVKQANDFLTQTTSDTGSEKETCQYLDYAHWQKQLLESDIYDTLLTYWRNTLEDGEYRLELPLRTLKSAKVQSKTAPEQEGDRYHFALHQADYQRLKQVCEQQRVTPYVVLLAAYQWMLHQRTGQRDIRVATPVTERPLPELEGMLGLFVNTLIIRAQCDRDTSAASWLDRVHQAVMGAQSHSAMPFEKLVEELVTTRDQEHEPLAQTLFNYLEASDVKDMRLGGLNVTSLPVPELGAKFDLSLFALKEKDGISLSFQYRTACYQAEDVAQLVAYYQTALSQLLGALQGEPERLLRTFPILSEDEWQQLRAWNRTEKVAFLPPQLSHATLGDALLAQAQKTPQQKALVFTTREEGKVVTHHWDYQTLDHQVNKLAHWLLEQPGVGPESRIAICMERSVQMVVSLLATVKAGCAYVPVDPEHPEQRLQSILGQASPALMLSQPEWMDKASGLCADLPCYVVDSAFSLCASFSDEVVLPAVDPEHLAYILFTSGSTGKPKGVAVPHVGVMNRLLWMQDTYPLDASDVVLQKTPYSFDVSVWEFFWPLMVGATLVVAEPSDHKDAEKLAHLIEAHGVTTLHFVPTMLQAFLDGRAIQKELAILENKSTGNCSSIRRVFTSGEALPFALKERFLSHFTCELHNLYGPTEASIDVTYWDCSTPLEGCVPIGYPIANMQTWILDDDLNPLPVGVAGELYLTGPGLARGYFGRDDLTEQAFIANPYVAQISPTQNPRWYARLYRTGDLARYRSDGSIEYLGRTDFQVKLRGLRIELGEIEAAILSLPFVKETIVVVEDQTLAAYVVLIGEEPSWQSWQAQLAQHLPAYMIPAVFMALPAMPVNVNGKADRKALPKLDLATHNAGAYVAPQNEKEQHLAEVFAEVLKLDKVSVGDNFFALGGDSILSLQVVSKARERGLQIQPKDVFKQASVRALAWVASTAQETRFSAEQSHGDTELSAIQHWFLTQNLSNLNQFNQAVLLASQQDIDASVLEKALWYLLQSHPLLCARFNRRDKESGNESVKASGWTQSIPNPAEIDRKAVVLNQHKWKIGEQDALEKTSQKEEPLQEKIDILCQQEQVCLSLQEGRLFRASLVSVSSPKTVSSAKASSSQRVETQATTSYRLLLVAHHLVIDAVSWHILLADLGQYYRHILAGNTPETQQPRTLPYKGWLEQVARHHAKAEQQEKGIAAWRTWEQQSAVQKALQNRYPFSNTSLFPEQAIGLADTVRFSLSRGETEKLLLQVGLGVNATTEEVCLAALSRALYQWTGEKTHLIQLEGHGRDQLDLDVSQTVGWFTRLYPALLTFDNEGLGNESMDNLSLSSNQWRKSLLATRQALSHLPELNHLLGKDAAFLSVQSSLVHLRSDEWQAPLVFNYLGQLSVSSDTLQAGDTAEMLFYKAPEALSAFRDEQNPRYWPIEMNVFVQQDKLSVNIQYAAQCLSREQAQTLASLMQHSLSSLAQVDELVKGAIAADYPLANVTDQQALTLVEKMDREGKVLEDLYTLSPAQQGMYFYCLDHPQAYISQSLVACRGAFHINHFKRAWERAVARHTALRTCFICDDVNEPHQAVLAQTPLIFTQQDYSALSVVAYKKQQQSLLQQERQSIDLEQAPLMRLSLLQQTDEAGEACYQLVWTIHHLIMDGWCLQRLVSEIMADYRTLCLNERKKSVAPVLVRNTAYRDFIEWLKDNQQSAKAESYWRSVLQGFAQANALPRYETLSQHHEQAACQDDFVSMTLGEQNSERLGQWARQQGVTLNTVIQGIWGLVLSRYMASDDIVFGVTTSGRPADLANADGIMGVFINTLPLRLRINGQAGLTDWLQALQAQNLKMRDYEQTPLAKILGWSEVPSHDALFHSVLVFENLPVSDSSPIEGLSLTLEAHHVKNNFPLTLRVVPKANLQFDLLLDPEKVDSHLAKDMVQGMMQCLDLITQEQKTQSSQNPEHTLGQVIRHWLTTSVYKVHKAQDAENALQQIYKQARHAKALEWESHQSDVLNTDNYEALLQQAAAFARALPEIRESEISASNSAGHEPVVAICLPRQKEQVLAMLAVWWKGAAWVCIDPEFPPSRIQDIIADAKPVYVIANDAPAWDTTCTWLPLAQITAKTATLINTPLPALPALKAEDTAYLVYTSGSTGKPKGVQVSHGNLISYVSALFDRIELPQDASMTTFATVAADLGFTCVLGALCSGRTLRLLPPEAYFDPETLALRLGKTPVSILKIAPAHLTALMSVEEPERLLPKTCLIVGGEVLDQTLFARLKSLAPGMKIINHYGPTEATIGCAAGEMHSVEDRVCIGTVLNNNQAYVVDNAGLMVPPCIGGELWIAGHGVAKGYLNKPEESARQFSRTDICGLTDSDLTNHTVSLTLYKTGDRVVQKKDGSLIYLGRRDDQVKIRGFRVEPDEVAVTLKKLPEVVDAVVMAIDGVSGKRLAAAVRVQNGEILNDKNTGEARFLKQLEMSMEQALPDYMVPRRWLALTHWPLQRNGKLDRQALKKRFMEEKQAVESEDTQHLEAASTSKPKSAMALPEEKGTSVQVTLQSIWQTLLKQDVGIHDNFFSLGGDSIIALQMVAKARQYGFKLTPKQLYAAPSVAELARCLGEKSPREENPKEESLSNTALRVENSKSNRDIQETLIQLWQDLLKQNVVPDDNFFSLGGDSIIALQMVAKARQHGFKLTPKQLYAAPTVAELASYLESQQKSQLERKTQSVVVEKSSSNEPPRSVSATVSNQTEQIPLLPIQHWFFEQAQPHPDYWNQAVMLQLPHRVEHEAMSRALEALLEKHPILTARFATSSLQKGITYQPSHETAAVYSAFEAQDEESLPALVAAIQKSINLTLGPIFKLAAFNMENGTARLLLVAHHLVVDGVSWRILGQDLHQAYHALCRGDKMNIGSESTTAAQWQQALQRFPEEKRTSARRYWQPMVNHYEDGILIPGAKPGRVSEVHSRQCVFSQVLTDYLLSLGQITGQITEHISRESQSHSACETAMLSALVQAVNRVFPRETILLEMESHGRRPLHDGQDLSETVGWLTSRFPVRFATQACTLEAIAGQLSSVPDLGIGYGVLRYLEQSLAFPTPQLLFNYLGQTGTLSADWQPIKGAGQARHPRSVRRQLIDVTAQVRDGQLEVNWQYPASLHSALEPVIEAFESYLNQTHQPDGGGSGSGVKSQNTQSDNQEVRDYPLTPVQQGMYLHSLASGSVYFNQTAVAINGELKPEPFLQAWQDTVNAEQALKACFWETEQGEPRQSFMQRVHLPVQILNWSALSNIEQHQALETLCQQDRAKGFELATPPLMRIFLIRISAREHWLIWSRHHLIVDAWCSALVIQDVMVRYRKALGDPTVSLRPRPDFSTYLDFLNQQDRQASLGFWKDYLQGYETSVALPRGESGVSFELIDHSLDFATTISLKALCRTHGITLNALFQSAWAMVLSHHSGQQDIVFGMTTSGRPPELDQAQRIVGIFINTLAVRLTLKADATLQDLLAQAHQQGVSLREHESVPLVEIASQSALQPGQSLFETLLVFENEALGEASSEGVSDNPNKRNQGLSVSPLKAYERNNYPLTLTIMPHDEVLLRMACDGERVSLKAAKAMLTSLEALLRVFTQAEQGTSLTHIAHRAFSRNAHFQGPERDLKGWSLGKGLLADWEAKKDLVAVVDGNGQLTYEQLLDRVLLLAQGLREKGITEHSRVAVCHPRRVDMLVALLGVYVSGASYVPLDPQQPIERLNLILEGAQPHCILTDGRIEIGSTSLCHSVPELVDQTTLSEYDRAEALARMTAQDSGLAYTIFTSGSTGRPKGVQVSRFALNNFLHSMVALIQIPPQEALLAVTTVGFDIAALELYLPLLTGGKVVIADEEQVRDGEALNRCLKDKNIRFMQATPITWQMLAEQETQDWSGLTSLVGGEALPASLAQDILARGATLLNMYGPTETTIWSSFSHITQENVHQPSLGKPITNTQLYVLDDWLNPVAPGATGELYIAGDGLAEGYLNQPELTQSVFLDYPLTTDVLGETQSIRLYKTGDKVFLSPEGELYFVGRTDFQIKLRGYRLETGEIEARLTALANIKEAVVTLWYANTPKACLVAYVTGNNVDITKIRKYLKEVLPSYMVPQYIVPLDTMPLNANNKIDRKALSVSIEQVVSADVSKTPPATQTEKAIARVWESLLGVSDLALEDDFFAFGGNSLLAGRMIAMLRRQLAIELPLAQVFRYPVLGDLVEQVQALFLSTETDDQTERLLVPMNDQAKANLKTHNTQVASVFVLPPAGGIVRAYQDMVQAFDNRFPVYGIESLALYAETKTEETIADLTKRYVRCIRSIQPKGPYRFVGWSFGAWLAMSLTRYLEEQGECVEWVTLIDARADVSNVSLQVTGLDRVKRYLACLDHHRREWLLDYKQDALQRLETSLQNVQTINRSQDKYAFETLVKLLDERQDTFSGEGEQDLRFMQMQLYMNSHKQMRKHVLQPVQASLHVFWSSQTLNGSMYQKGAMKGEWDKYGDTNKIILEGDHDSIVRDNRVSSYLIQLVDIAV